MSVGKLLRKSDDPTEADQLIQTLLKYGCSYGDGGEEI
jgi:hypothetical protein